MNVGRLILREIAHRRTGFLLSLASVATAVACLIGSLTLLDAHSIKTGELLTRKQAEIDQALAAKQKAVEQAGADLEDSMRKITLGLGFNIFILPNDQDPTEIDLHGTLSKTMPEDYVHRLVHSKIVTINHLLPQVIRRIEWPEMKRTIILTGTRGEVPLSHQDAKQPLQEAVPAGSMVLGHQLGRQLELKKGSRVKLLGKEFTILGLHKERGNADDSTVWINLAEAQELLGLQNLVNVIQALECNCAAADRVGDIRNEIAKILPGTQVRELGPPALARAEARNKAKLAAVEALSREKAAGEESLERERESRESLLNQREQFASILVPLVVLGAAVWIGYLALVNVRQRIGEIGILRAIGLRTGQIVALFLGKAVCIGLGGAIVGFIAGMAIGLSWSGLSFSAEASAAVHVGSRIALALVVAPVLSIVASWIPAVWAARQDPAIVLQSE